MDAILNCNLYRCAICETGIALLIEKLPNNEAPYCSSSCAYQACAVLAPSVPPPDYVARKSHLGTASVTVNDYLLVRKTYFSVYLYDEEYIEKELKLEKLKITAYLAGREYDAEEAQRQLDLEEEEIRAAVAVEGEDDNHDDDESRNVAYFVNNSSNQILPNEV